jgi:CheY-like chemotaxis protein/predicted  nucleic acid-binding Zn-ribbon protein
MPKKILLIENDAAFAGEVSGALEAAGFGVRVTGDGKDGLDLAREWGPDAVVLCVELPGMSGYLVCQKLRKDDALKDIPLVLTSAEATQATFENHRKLKVRADEYLLKPYAPAALQDALAALIGLPEAALRDDTDADAAELDIEPPAGAGAGEAAFELDGAGTAEGDEELVTLEEEIGIEALGGESVGDLPAFDLQTLPEESTADSASDEDLRLLDDAFDGLAAPPAPPVDDEQDPCAALDLALREEKPVELDALDAAAASLPDDAAGSADLERLDDDADALLGALTGPDLDPGPSFEDDRPARPSFGASFDRVRDAGGRSPQDGAPLRAPPVGEPAPGAVRIERELADAREALAAARATTGAREREVAQLRGELASLTGRAEDAEARASEAQTEIRTLRARAATLTGEAEQARALASDAERKAQDAQRRASDAERRAAEAEVSLRRAADDLQSAQAAAGRAEALERELEEARTEVIVARGEAEGARGEVEKRTAELRRRLQELEAANAKNEERILKAYQKIKGDEKVRERIRKAIAIAGQLLDEGLPPEAPGAEKARVAAASRE